MPRGGSIYWDAVLRKDSQKKVLSEARKLQGQLQDIFNEAENGLQLISDNDLDQLKKAARATDPLKQKIRELSNEASILRNRLKAGTIGEVEFREEMARVKRETIALASSTKNLSSAQKTLTATSASAQRSLEGLNKQQRSNSILQTSSTAIANRYGVSLEGIKSPAVAAGVGIAALAFGLVKTVQVAGDFEKRMNVVRSVVQGTEEQFRQLTDRARDLGTETVFSAAQVADAMKALALAGFRTEQILASISGTLDLAVIGAIDLEQAADITVNVLNQFGLAATDTERVINTLVYGVNAATINVEDMAESMKYLGPIARALGDDVETATAIIAVLGNNGLKGTLATRALGTALVRLAKPTKQMVEKMEELNLEFYDSQGNFIGLVPMIAELEGALADATQEQKQNTLSTLFGNEAIQEMLILLDAGSDGLNNILKDMDAAGDVAERTAKTQLEGFNAAWQLLRRSVEGLGITLGNTLLPILSVVFRALASFFNLINNGLRSLEKFTPGLSDAAREARDFDGALSLFTSTSPDVVKAIDDIKSAVGDNDKEGLKEAITNLSNYMTGEAKSSFLEFANDAIDKAKSVDEAWTLVWQNFTDNARAALETDLLVKEQMLADFDRNRDPNVSPAGSGAVMTAASDAFQNQEDLNRLGDLYQRNVIDNFFGDLEIPAGLAVTDLLEEGLTVDKEFLKSKLSEGYDLFDEDIDELYDLVSYYEDVGTKLRTARDVATNIATSAAPIPLDDPARQKLVADIESSKQAIEQLPKLTESITTASIEDANNLADGVDTGVEVLGDSVASLETTLEELNAAYESATDDSSRAALLDQIKGVEDLLDLIDKRREPKSGSKGKEVPPAGSLAALKEALQEAEELRDKATSEATRSAANDVVVSLEKQIKAIEDTFKAQLNLSGSLADLREKETQAVEEYNNATTEADRKAADDKISIIRDQIASIEDIYDTSKDLRVESIASEFDLLQSQLDSGIITQTQYSEKVKELGTNLDQIIPTLNKENQETQKAIALKADLNKALDTTSDRQKELKAIIADSLDSLSQQFSQSVDNLEELSSAELANARSTLEQRLSMVESWGSSYSSLIGIIKTQLNQLDVESKRRLEEFRLIASDLVRAAAEAQRSLQDLTGSRGSLKVATTQAEEPFNDIIRRSLENIEELNNSFNQLSANQKEEQRRSFESLVAEQQRIIESAILARAEAITEAERKWQEEQDKGVVERQRSLAEALYENKQISYQTYNDLLTAERDYWESVISLAEYGSDTWLEAYQRIAEINKLIDPFTSLEGLTPGITPRQGRPETPGEFNPRGTNENLGIITAEGIVLSAQEMIDATKIAADTWRAMLISGTSRSAADSLAAAEIIWDTMLARQKTLALQRFGNND
ncbi:MAG: phage tail tape measure protein, partial [Waterburya sp.]